MSLTADLRLSRGAHEFRFELDVRAGETIALVGPNGAGKSTCLHALAGLLPVAAGEVRLDGRLLEGPAANGARRVSLPPEQRPIGLVFQDHRLFPHLTAVANVAFGPRSRGVGRRAAEAAARVWLARFGLSDCAERRPHQLSGGQAQRVALARALAGDPRLLLLDEPLAAVDASARLELRRELREHLEQFAGVRLLVTHDIADALALAERFVVFEAGRVVQAGGIADLIARPATRYVADLVGLNCYPGIARDGVVEVAGGRLVVSDACSGAVLVSFPPRSLALFRERPDGSPRNVWRATVLGLEPSLERVRVHLGGALPTVAEVTPAAVRALELKPGAELWVALKATEITVAPV